MKRTWIGAVVMVALALAASGCATVLPHRHSDSIGTAATAATPWTPPSGAAATPGEPATAPPALPAAFTAGAVSLSDVVDLALANNPQTRIAWLEARAAQAGVGAAEAAYLPTVDLDGALTTSRSLQNAGRSASTQTTWGPSLSLNYLLFDFGGREAQLSGAQQTLIAANFLHNQAIQDVILRTQQAWFGYLYAKALLTAQDSTIKERQTSLDAAEARHKAGIATIADVLQARTALSQAQLNRETIEGGLRTIEGALATTMGVSPATRFETGELPLDVPAGEVHDAVETLLARAAASRPELAAARADAERAAQRIREVRAQGLPNLSFSSTIGQTFFGAGSNNGTPYAAGLRLQWPAFTGFRNQYEVQQAELEAAAAREGVRELAQRVDLEVWTSYFALQTASQRMTTARDLLASAQQSADVARSRYRAGVGSILDLLTAEAALESARAQEVQSRADWFTAVAQLAHDTGSLAAQEGNNSASK